MQRTIRHSYMRFDKSSAGVIMTRNPAANALGGDEGPGCGRVDEFPNPKAFTSGCMVEFNACRFNRVHLSDVARIIVGRCSADVTQENVSQRLVLFRIGAFVDIQDDTPGRSNRWETRLGWLGVVPSSRDRDP